MSGKKKPQSPESHEHNDKNEKVEQTELEMRVEVTLETDRKLRSLADEYEEEHPEVDRYESLMA